MKIISRIKMVCAGLDARQKILIVALLIFIALYFAFYPKYYLVNDEHHYVRGAYLLGQGKLWIGDSLRGYHFISDGDRYFPRYPPGMYVLLAPFTWFGFHAMFILGLILHIVGFIVFVKTLRLLKIDIIAGLLYLFYPPFVYYADTLFSDYALTVFILLGFYFYLKERPTDHFLSGLFFGFSFLLKVYAPVFFIIFYLFALINNRKKFWLMILGAFPFGLMHLGYNWLMYGAPWKIAYDFFYQYGQGSNPFVVHNILGVFMKNLLQQLILLILIYPFMLFGIIKSKKEIILSSVFGLIFFSSII
ncbi:MAG: glycosyltransferase family 87 protein, partial [Candidatus Woesearchaeota archaeon]|nr:glycosyltransferase family 87 protein [Candidatus Woesearchaeota archaeon]